MQYLTAAAALAAACACAQAAGLERRADAADLYAKFKPAQPHAKIVNNCNYKVNVWSIEKEMGCSAEAAFALDIGGVYAENFRNDTEGGVSIKMSKADECGGDTITQLEYKIVNGGQFSGNYLDVSFVDCTQNQDDCPGYHDGYKLISGNQDGQYPSAENNEHCPIFDVKSAAEAVKVSYVNWDDRQTKWCNVEANLVMYLCGEDGSSGDEESSAPASSAMPSPSSEIETQPEPTITSTEEATVPSSTEEATVPSSTEEAFVVAAAAVTEAPEPVKLVTTAVVYVTEYVNARHAHGRRHQHFHA